VATGAGHATAKLVSRFQVTGCGRIGFDPRLSLQLYGGLGRNGHPGLSAVLHLKPNEADAQAASVTLPRGELLDLHHLHDICSGRVPPERCPPSSRIGRLRLWSPIAEGPLEGPVYLRRPAEGLPALLVVVRGHGIRLLIRGRTEAPDGRLRVHLGPLPDLPLSTAILSLAGGRRGIVVNSDGLCGGGERAMANIVGQTGTHKRIRPLPALAGRC
jgi:hypothetical protein